MRTVNFRVFFEQKFLPGIGKDPANFAPGSAGGNTQLEYVNDALAAAVRSAFWPELQKVEERTLNADNVLPWSAASKTDIDAIEGIYTTEANAIGKIAPLPYEDSPAGYRVFDTTGTVWVRIRPYPPVFSRTEWDYSEIYSKNGTCFSPASGRTFRSLVDANEGNEPEADDGTHWEVVAFPEMFVPYVRAKAAAAHWDDERKFELAGRRESHAGKILFHLKKSKGL